MTETDPVKQLADGGHVSLASWLGDPLERSRAEHLLAGVQRRMRSSRCVDAERFSLRLAEMICHYWAGYDIEATYQTMSVLPGDRHRNARLELCYGQLLMARRLPQALQHLERGFQLAAHLLEAEDYFRVLRRHELLRQLPPVAQPADAAPLDSLLKEAQVIARLKGPGQRRETGPGAHRDTID